MTLIHNIQFIFHDRAHLFRFCRIHDHHDPLPEKCVILFVRLFFQCEQTILSCSLRHFYQRIDQRLYIVAFALK